MVSCWAEVSLCNAAGPLSVWGQWRGASRGWRFTGEVDWCLKNRSMIPIPNLIPVIFVVQEYLFPVSLLWGSICDEVSGIAVLQGRISVQTDRNDTWWRAEMWSPIVKDTNFGTDDLVVVADVCDSHMVITTSSETPKVSTPCNWCSLFNYPKFTQLHHYQYGFFRKFPKQFSIQDMLTFPASTNFP